MSYSIVVQGRRDAMGCFATYWHPGSLDDALAAALSHARDALELTHARPDRVGVSDDPPPTAFRDEGGGLHAAPKLHCWDASEEDDGFALPAGVVFAAAGTAFDLDEMQEALASGDEEDFAWCELVVGAHRLRDVFLAWFDHLARADGLEIRTLGHWDDAGTTQVWLRGDEPFQGASIWQLLETRWLDLVANGYVEVAVHARREDAIVRVTEHKTLLFTSGDAGARDSFLRKAASLGFERTDPFRSVAFECAHYHYRPPGSRSREELLAALPEWGFHEVDAWEETAERLGDDADD